MDLYFISFLMNKKNYSVKKKEHLSSSNKYSIYLYVYKYIFNMAYYNIGYK